MSYTRNPLMHLPPMPSPDPEVHPDFCRVHVRSVKGDSRLNYFERVIQLSLFFFELSEEGFDAHSELGWEQLPAPGLDRREVQKLFRSTWYGQQRLSLIDAALAFHAWLAERGMMHAGCEDAGAAIQVGCLPYERAFQNVDDPHVRLERSYVRLARFYRRMIREDFTQNSRIAEYCVPNDQAPHSVHVPGWHPEHVVPCAVLRNLALDRYVEQWSVMQVAALMKRLLMVAWIPQAQKNLLDDGPEHLRDRMPENWDPLHDCIYMRLHAKGIQVPSVPGHPCTCDRQ